jgi:hypothetical protein
MTLDATEGLRGGRASPWIVALPLKRLGQNGSEPGSFNLAISFA